VTPAKLNSAAAPTVAVANDEITTAKILDANVTAAKLAATLDLSSKTVTLPDDSVTLAKLAEPLTLRTAQATTSGTSFDFTDIPSWVRRITVMFSGVSTSGVSNIAIRLGTSGGFVESGYLGVGSNLAASPSFGNNDTGFRVSAVNSATSVWHGSAVLTNLANNVWTITGAMGRSDAEAIGLLAGSVDAGGQVDRIRVTTLAGNDFDAGSVNIMYEG
jgi:hypothetical protein